MCCSHQAFLWLRMMMAFQHGGLRQRHPGSGRLQLKMQPSMSKPKGACAALSRLSFAACEVCTLL